MENLYANSHEALVVGLARNGDRDAFAELVRRHQGWLRSLLLRSCGDAGLADDISQQVFLKSWRKLVQLRDATRFGPWLRRMAVNEWLQYLRRHDPLRLAAGDAEDSPTTQNDPALTMDLEQALRLLEPTVRLCIVLSYQEQMSHGDIAKLTGLALGTVKSHIRRGAERLRKQLGAYAPLEKRS